MIAMVKRYLLDREFKGREARLFSDFTAYYVGNGKWHGRGKIATVDPDSPALWQEIGIRNTFKAIDWHFYEKSQTLEVLN